MEDDPIELPVTWGVTAMGKVGVAFGAIAAGWVLIAMGLVQANLLAWLIVALVSPPIAFFLYRCASATMTLHEREVVVRGVFKNRRADRSKVIGAIPTEQGLAIGVADERSLLVWAVQKAPLSKWAGRHTRADIVVATICEWAGELSEED